ncbi:MAG: outer membrane protein assembly factor BamA, partial [Nitrospirae bacterium]|nr:outer membrane protein assembly factor BamA [Nitrospirota bacterium]
ERLKELYREEGYHGAVVIPILKTLEPGKEGERRVALTYSIDEGKKVRIAEVRIQGVSDLPFREVRKGVKTKAHFSLTSWLTGSGIYKEETAGEDAERIRSLYLDRGYLQVQVGDPRVDLDETGEWMTVTYSLTEGPRFRIRRIGFENPDIFNDRELREAIKLREGDLFNRSRLRGDLAALTDLYGEKGYAFAEINPRILPDEGAKEVDLTFAVEKGEKVKVRKIQILGNEKTRDKVIRREIRLNEQETMNTAALRRSFQRLNNLNFFENIEITPQPIAKDAVDLNVKVKERPTGAFSIGGGYSSVYGFLGTTDVTEGNLLGRGQLLRFKGEFGALRTNYDVTFREPWFLDEPTAISFNLFKNLRTFDLYDIGSQGGTVGLSRTFNEYWNGGLTYGIQEVEVSGNPPVSISPGRSSTGSLGASVNRDTRDVVWDPRSGSKNTVTVEYADRFLGGSNVFVKYYLDTTWFYPMPRDTAFMAHGRFAEGRGLRGKDLPLNERFYVGGIYTVRGFDYGKAGTPATVDAATGEILGADKELIFNLEYIVPLVKEARINGVLFYDAGAGFAADDSLALGDLRTSVGGGFRWLSPIGPLRLEWGYNLDPQPGERQGIWEFSIGTLF